MSTILLIVHDTPENSVNKIVFIMRRWYTLYMPRRVLHTKDLIVNRKWIKHRFCLKSSETTENRIREAKNPLIYWSVRWEIIILIIIVVTLIRVRVESWINVAINENNVSRLLPPRSDVISSHFFFSATKSKTMERGQRAFCYSKMIIIVRNRAFVESAAYCTTKIYT